MVGHSRASIGDSRQSARGVARSSLAAMVSARDAAHILGVHEKTIRRAIRRGDLAAEKHGRSFAIALDDLERYRRQSGQVPAPDRPPANVVPFPALERSARFPAPVALTRFIGREREVREIAALLARSDVRLITLHGPGGVGKTRLGLQVAEEIADRFDHGVAFIPLAAVRRVEAVLPTMLQALGVRGQESLPARDQLVAWLAARVLLLVIDNVEQIVAAAPILVDVLLQAPRVKALVTSRTPLRVAGERIFTVPPLSLPPEPTTTDTDTDRAVLESGWEALAAYEAVQLFVDRARAADAHFHVTPDNAPAIAAICRRTDGLPLALELAAARTRLLTPAALLTQLARRLPVLADGPRDQPDRLRTMHDAIAWSHDILAEDEQRLFRGLAVFVGGFSFEAIEATQRDDGVSQSEGREDPRRAILPVLTNLVDQSLIQRGADVGPEPRYAMLETVREFGLEQLQAKGELAGAKWAHAAWCLALAERAERELVGPEQAAWVQRLEADLANMRAAHDWFAEQGAHESALRLGGAIGWLWSSAPHLAEGRDRFDALLAMPDVEVYPAALAKVLATAGDIADWQGDQPRARGYYERALAIYRALDDRPNEASMLRGLGSSAIDRGEFTRAVELLEEGLRLAEASETPWEVAATTNLLGVIAFVQGDLATAQRRHRMAADVWHSLGDEGHVVTALTSLGWAALLAGDLARAAATYGDALALIDASDEWSRAWCAIGAGGIAAGLGNRDLAVTLLAGGLAEQRRLDVEFRPHNQQAIDQFLARLEAQMSIAAFADARSRGGALDNAALTAMTDSFLREVAISPPVRPPFEQMTEREREVLRLLAAGRSDREIAEVIFVSRRTASKHVSSILAKLGAPSRTAAVALANQHGLL